MKISHMTVYFKDLTEEEMACYPEHRISDDCKCWCSPSVQAVLTKDGEEAFVVVHNGDQ